MFHDNKQLLTTFRDHYLTILYGDLYQNNDILLKFWDLNNYYLLILFIDRYSNNVYFQFQVLNRHYLFLYPIGLLNFILLWWGSWIFFSHELFGYRYFLRKKFSRRHWFTSSHVEKHQFLNWQILEDYQNIVPNCHWYDSIHPDNHQFLSWKFWEIFRIFYYVMGFF